MLVIEKKDLLKEIYTAEEASFLWGLGSSTLRTRLRISKAFKEGIDYRKAGSVWLVTKEAMYRVYGEPNLKEEKK